MKLLMIIMNDENREGMIEELSKNGITVTVISSTGEFLNYGDTTMLVGVHDNQCDYAVGIMKDYLAKLHPNMRDEEENGHIFLMDVLHKEVKPGAI